MVYLSKLAVCQQLRQIDVGLALREGRGGPSRQKHRNAADQGIDAVHRTHFPLVADELFKTHADSRVGRDLLADNQEAYEAANAARMRLSTRFLRV